MKRYIAKPKYSLSIEILKIFLSKEELKELLDKYNEAKTTLICPRC